MTKSGTPGFIAATLLYCLMLCFLRWPVVSLFPTHLLGGIDGDTNLYFWLVTTFPHNIIERGWFETNSFYPYQDTLAWSDNFLFPSAFFYLLNSVCGLAEIPSWNLLILLTQLLNGISVFFLSRQLGGKQSSSLLIGSIFIAVPYFAQNLGHPQLQFFFWIPLGLVAFLSLLSKPALSKSFLLASILTLTFLSTIYYAVALALTCVLIFAFQLISKVFPSKQLLIYLLSSAVFCALLLSPFLLPYIGVKHLFDARGLHEFYYFGISAFSFLASAPISLLYGSTSVLSRDEAYFGWGLVTTAILVLGAKRIWQASSAVSIFLILALLFANPSFGNFVGMSRNLRLWAAILFSWMSFISLCLCVSVFKLKPDSNTETQIHRDVFLYLSAVAVLFTLIALGPLGYPEIKVAGFGVFRLFYEFFPGLDSLRAISRLGSVVILLLLLSAIPSLNFAGKKILFLIPLLIFESQVTSFPLAPLPEAPRIFERLTSLARNDDAILVSPFSGELDKNNQVISWSRLASINSAYLIALRHSRLLLMNGYSGQRPRTIYDLPRILRRFPSEAALNALLKFEKLKYIVILGSKIDGFSATEFQAEILKFADKVRIVTSEDNNFIVELLRSAQ